MPKCMKCYEMFPPQFCVGIPEANNEDVHQCIYCAREITEIPVDKGGVKETYTKEQCIKDYKVFMKKLMEKKNIADALVKGKVDDKSNIIIP